IVSDCARLRRRCCPATIVQVPTGRGPGPTGPQEDDQPMIHSGLRAAGAALLVVAAAAASPTARLHAQSAQAAAQAAPSPSDLAAMAKASRDSARYPYTE